MGEKKEQETQIMDIDKDTRKEMIKFLSDSREAYHGKEDSDNKVIADFRNNFNILNMGTAIKIIERIEKEEKSKENVEKEKGGNYELNTKRKVVMRRGRRRPARRKMLTKEEEDARKKKELEKLGKKAEKEEQTENERNAQP